MQHDFVLLDRSGSMGSLWAEAVGAVNTYVQKLREDNVDTGVTILAFDQGPDGKLELITLRDRITPVTMKALEKDESHPRGMTPLNDAVGRIVTKAETGGYEKVAIIIMTDGLENASQELTVQQAKDLLDRCRAKNWQVIFLGANFDNAQQATSYGNAAQATVQSSAMNLVATMRATASKRGLYSATGEAMAYTDEEKAALKQ